MEGIAAKELEDLPEIIETCSMVYMPEIGYLLAIPAWRTNLSEEDMALPNCEFKVRSSVNIKGNLILQRFFHVGPKRFRMSFLLWIYFLMILKIKIHPKSFHEEKKKSLITRSLFGFENKLVLFI